MQCCSKRSNPHLDMVSVEVEFSHFKRAKHWFLSHGIEVQGYLKAIEDKIRTLKKSPQGRSPSR